MKRPPAIRVSCGFTLIELAVVVAIIGILASIAYPNYTEYVRRGHRADAQSILMDISQRQRQYFTYSRSYAADLTTLNVSVPATVTPYYTISVNTGDTPPSFVGGKQVVVIGAIQRDPNTASSPLSGQQIRPPVTPKRTRIYWRTPQDNRWNDLAIERKLIAERCIWRQMPNQHLALSCKPFFFSDNEPCFA